MGENLLKAIKWFSFAWRVRFLYIAWTTYVLKILLVQLLPTWIALTLACCLLHRCFIETVWHLVSVVCIIRKMLQVYLWLVPTFPLLGRKSGHCLWSDFYQGGGHRQLDKRTWIKFSFYIFLFFNLLYLGSHSQHSVVLLAYRDGGLLQLWILHLPFLPNQIPTHFHNPKSPHQEAQIVH